MRMLWVKMGGLWPPNSGGRLRSYNLLRELSRHHDITVVTTHEPGASHSDLHRWLPDCRKVIEVAHHAVKHNDPRFPFLLAKSWLTRQPVDIERCRSRAMQEAISGELASGGYELCVADFLCTLPNLAGTQATPVVLFEHNVEHMIWKRLARIAPSRPRQFALELEWRRLRRFEACACRRVTCTLAVSGTDRDQLRSLAPGAPVFAVPTGVDVDYFLPRPQIPERREVVFLGSMDWYPNEDGMRWFIDAILPRLRERAPDVAVTIVGRNPSAQFSSMAQAHGVGVTGTVEDVRGYLARAAVCVVPLRIGGGTRLKIFEALAMGKAIVSTTIGAEGLPLTEGVEYVRCDKADDFAEQLAELLDDPERRREMGATGRERVSSRYAWPRVANEFTLLCEAACLSNRHGIARGSKKQARNACARRRARSRRVFGSMDHTKGG